MIPAVTDEVHQPMPTGVPVHVLIIHPRDLAAPTTGGIQTFLHDFVKFSPPDFEITFAGLTSDPVRHPVGRRTRLAIDDRQAWLLPLGRTGRLPFNPLRLAAMAAAQLRLRAQMMRGGSILQLHRPFRSLLIAGHRGPRIQYVHLDVRDLPGPSNWPRLRALYRHVADAALERMDLVYTVSQHGVDHLQSMYPGSADQIRFLPNWFDENVFWPPSLGQRNEARRRAMTEHDLHGLSDDEPVVLFAGRLDANKDPLLAIDAFAALVEPGRRAHLLVAGDGELLGPLTARVAALGLEDRIHLLGDQPRTSLATLMRASDALLLTSHSEGGGPRVVVEALASGLPVVAPPVGEVRRMVADCVTGRVFDERSPASIGAALAWVLDQPARQLSESAALAARPYTARAVLEPLYDAYRRLARPAR